MSVDAGILSLKPTIRRNTKQSEVVIKEANQGSEDSCLKTGEHEDQKQILGSMQSGKQMQAFTSVKCC